MTKLSSADFSGLSIAKIAAWSFSAIFVIVLIFAATYVVSPSSYGVVTRFGQIQAVTAPGLHLKMPFIDDAAEIQGALRSLAVENTAVSRDIQQVRTKVIAQYRIPANVAKDIFINYRDDLNVLDQAVVGPSIETTTKSITARYTAEQLITKRDEVQSELKIALAKALMANAGLILAKVDITDFAFSDEFTKAIEDNVVAERAVKTAQQGFERKKVEAQRVVSDAQAEADATRIRADAEAYAMRKQNENATELTVRLREADAKLEFARNTKEWRPTVIGATPLVNVDAK